MHFTPSSRINDKLTKTGHFYRATSSPTRSYWDADASFRSSARRIDACVANEHPTSRRCKLQGSGFGSHSHLTRCRWLASQRVSASYNCNGLHSHTLAGTEPMEKNSVTPTPHVIPYPQKQLWQGASERARQKCHPLSRHRSFRLAFPFPCLKGAWRPLARSTAYTRTCVPWQKPVPTSDAQFGNPWRERFYTRAPTAGRNLYHKEVKKEVFSTGGRQNHTFLMVTDIFQTCYFNMCCVVF